MGVTAENVAVKYGISREEQDEMAYLSQVKAEKAIKAGVFKEQIVPVVIPQKKGDPKVFDTDEGPRFGITMQDLAKMKPIFRKDGTVTAATSSGINDGAAAVLLAAKEKAAELGMAPLAKIVSFAAAGVDPNIMGIGPVPATQKALAKAGLTLDQIDLIEMNEAFAAQAIACLRELQIPWDITNVNGSAISIGHPIGCSGARIVLALVNEMQRRKVKRGMASLCIGGGMGMALAVEAV